VYIIIISKIVIQSRGSTGCVEIKTKADEFVESAAMNPAFEESAMFENMIDPMIDDEYEMYVFDTAPIAFFVTLPIAVITRFIS
jgi:anion-transporting  ArsA/GET3 family ATPase